ncbi:MAG TPA: alpha/beta hydrolase [Acidimicrobiales bacterium]
MANYVLIHGAGSDSWYWHLVVPKLEALGHVVIAPDLPCDDDSAGLREYLDAAFDAIGDRKELVVVAQSMGGFTAPLLCDRVSVRMLIMVAAMVPAPGESPGEWWSNTGHEEAKREQDARDGRAPDRGFDPVEIFLHDVPPQVVAESIDHVKNQSGTPFAEPWPLATWPDVPTRFLLCRDDRFFPAEFMRRIVRERLGIEPDEMQSGHLPALSHPDELVARLEEYRLEL